MAFTDIDICSHALVMIGENPITSLTDGTTAANACANLYETTVQDLLTRYPWRFASNIVQLSRLTDAPANKWDAAYQIPGTALSIKTVMVEDRPIDFDRFEDKIWCNADAADEVYLEATFRVDEAFWPPYFVTLVEIQLASLLAHSVAAQVDTADWLDKKALRHGALARTRDSMARTAARIDVSRLRDSRFRSSTR